MQRDEDETVWSQVGRYSSLGFILPLSTLAGWLIGWLLDKLFHTHFLFIVFLVLGMVAGFIELIKKLNTETRRDGG
jgi:F0F1-type ATP synthase assembly protein I